MKRDRSVCRHCGRPITFLGEGAIRNGWAHDYIEISPGNMSPWEEPCRINPVTLNNARGTKFAAPVENSLQTA